eukprot:GEMP01092790.1.p1 GENE.GEMP01092790.1~~GEMP01092790.1.p1  ORF type:complete len:214 (+),score=30.04 GEMP01092790.1:114-755(+)
MVCRLLALFLMADALNPYVNFTAGAFRCWVMCRTGCTTNRNGKFSACVAIAEDFGIPWVRPTVNAEKTKFNFKWCRDEYHIQIVAQQPLDGDFFQAITYPMTNQDTGDYAEVDHLDWFAPSCNTTSTPSCTDISAKRLLPVDDGLDKWMAAEGNKCRKMANSNVCNAQCYERCAAWCDCGWGDDAVKADMGIIVTAPLFMFFVIFRWHRVFSD